MAKLASNIDLDALTANALEDEFALTDEELLEGLGLLGDDWEDASDWEPLW